MADEAKRRSRRREDQAAAIARLAAAYGDVDPVELARRVVAAAAAAGPGAAQQEHLIDALWAINAVREELNEIEPGLLGDVAALIEDENTALTWVQAAEPYGITGAGLSARWQRRRPSTTEHED